MGRPLGELCRIRMASHRCKTYQSLLDENLHIIHQPDLQCLQFAFIMAGFASKACFPTWSNSSNFLLDYRLDAMPGVNLPPRFQAFLANLRQTIGLALFLDTKPLVDALTGCSVIVELPDL